jgi:hypothetical protein
MTGYTWVGIFVIGMAFLYALGYWIYCILKNETIDLRQFRLPLLAVAIGLLMIVLGTPFIIEFIKNKLT